MIFEANYPLLLCSFYLKNSTTKPVHGEDVSSQAFR